MIFTEINDYDGSNNYQAPLPRKYRHLLIKGFRNNYYTGSWGSSLSLWLETRDLIFWLHYFFRSKKGRMYAKVSTTIYSLYHLEEGSMIAVQEGKENLAFTPDRSHFLILSPGQHLEIMMEKGTTISLHADFKRSYLDPNLDHLQVLKPILSQLGRDMGSTLSETSIVHNYIMGHSWKRILEMLPHVHDPILFIEGHARELLRIYNEHLEVSTTISEPRGLYGPVSEERIKAVQEVCRIIESDISITHLQSSLCRKSGLNKYDLNYIFKEIYRISIRQYLIRLRMNLAKELTLSTDQTDTDIAAQCGYQDTSYFCELFKKTYGLTPGQLRKAAHFPPIGNE